MFRTVRDQDVPSRSCSQAVWHILLPCVQWKTPDDGQRNFPKHVEFYSKNKFEKLVYLVGFITRNNTVTLWRTCKQKIRLCALKWVSHQEHAVILENCILLGNYAASSGNSLPTFLENLSVPSSAYKTDGTVKFSRNVGKELPLLAA